MPGKMTAADAKFLKDMIAHHRAALVMSTKYLDDNSPSERQARVSDLARNIIKAQTAEIAVMSDWLRQGGYSLPSANNSGMKM